jgi:hypothetical protein
VVSANPARCSRSLEACQHSLLAAEVCLHLAAFCFEKKIFEAPGKNRRREKFLGAPGALVLQTEVLERSLVWSAIGFLRPGAHRVQRRVGPALINRDW